MHSSVQTITKPKERLYPIKTSLPLTHWYDRIGWDGTSLHSVSRLSKVCRLSKVIAIYKSCVWNILNKSPGVSNCRASGTGVHIIMAILRANALHKGLYNRARDEMRNTFSLHHWLNDLGLSSSHKYSIRYFNANVCLPLCYIQAMQCIQCYAIHTLTLTYGSQTQLNIQYKKES